MSLKQVPRYVGMVLMTCMIGYVLKPSGLAGAEVGRLLQSVLLVLENKSFQFFPSFFRMMMFWNDASEDVLDVFPKMFDMMMFWNSDPQWRLNDDVYDDAGDEFIQRFYSMWPSTKVCYHL